MGKSIENLNDLIESPIKMDEPNLNIKIYEGRFSIGQNSKYLNLNGAIFFNWLPNSGTHFNGTTEDSISMVDDLFEEKELLDLIINNSFFGKCFISDTDFKNKQSVIIKGIISGEAILDDISINVDKISFSIPNLKEFMGLPVQKIDDINFYQGRNRICLENKNYIINIDKEISFKKKYEKLNSEGGYMILYGGELTKKNGYISYKESQQIFECLNYFLTFINGRRTSAFFLHGTTNKKINWIDYTDQFIDIHKYSISWASKNSVNAIMQVWKKFSTLWDKPNDREFLQYAIHWYVEANKSSAITESAIIMVQTALELIYNWLVVEHKKILVGKDSRDISASNKIRLLLSIINIESSVPKEFSELLKISDTLDGPEIITKIRNSIVHSNEDKRKELKKIDSLAKFQALTLSIWYIELSLLYILECRGTYYNRCAGNRIAYYNEQPSPW